MESTESKEIKNNIKYKTVIFDLDGTLLDTIKDLEIAMNMALEKLGHEKRTHEEIKSFIGHGSEELVRKAMPKGSSNREIQNCLKIFKDYYFKNMLENTLPYKGIIELLTTLTESEIEIGVVSNKPDAATKKACEHFFDGLVTEAMGDNQYRASKPAPDNLLEVMRTLGATDSDTCYVGDSAVDVLTAQNTGIACYSTMWGYGDKAEIEKLNAERMVYSAEELQKILLGE